MEAIVVVSVLGLGAGVIVGWGLIAGSAIELLRQK